MGVDGKGKAAKYRLTDCWYAGCVMVKFFSSTDYNLSHIAGQSIDICLI
jgi:hypothetical protein